MAWMSTQASRRRRKVAGFRGRDTYIMGRERDALEHAVHSTNGAAVLIIQFVEAYVQVVADGRPSPRPRHGPLCC